MRVAQLNVGVDCKSYLVADEAARVAIVVDPLLDQVQRYVEALREAGLALTFAVDTHTHADHLSGSRALAEAMGARIAGQPAVAVHRPLREGDALEVGRESLAVWATPGHTADSISLVGAGHALVGDTLLVGTTGRTDLPTGDAEAEWRSIERILTLPDETRLWPGHDYSGKGSSTVGDERRGNARVLMGREAFVRAMNQPRSSKPALLEQALVFNSRPI